METIDFRLDTQPMAESLDKVSNHVNATTAAIVAMQAAVIQAEKESADQVCQNVDKGFYSLIRSQISSKLAKQFTDMNTAFTLLLQYSKSLSATQNRMESDIGRLRRQYYKIFHSLDKSLENRIGQLDNHAVELANARRRLITERKLKQVARTVNAEKDFTSSDQLITTARLKQKTSSALMAIGQKISEDEFYKQQVSSLLNKQKIETKEELFVPVICVEEQSRISPDTSFTHAYFPDYLDRNTSAMLESHVNASVSDILDEEFKYREEVSSAFKKMLDASGLDQRTKQVMAILHEEGTK